VVPPDGGAPAQSPPIRLARAESTEGEALVGADPDAGRSDCDCGRRSST
jgi:hypothetical protein